MSRARVCDVSSAANGGALHFVCTFAHLCVFFPFFCKVSSGNYDNNNSKKQKKTTKNREDHRLIGCDTRLLARQPITKEARPGCRRCCRCSACKAIKIINNNKKKKGRPWLSRPRQSGSSVASPAFHHFQMSAANHFSRTPVPCNVAISI